MKASAGGPNIPVIPFNRPTTEGDELAYVQ